MSSVHDVDVLLLLATSLAAKRRPAEPGEIVAAIDLIQGNVPGEEKLSEAFVRLGSHGLLQGNPAGVALTAAAEALIESLPRKAAPAERLFELKGLLANARPAADGVPVVLPAETLRAAILAHRAAAASGVRNLLVDKPKPEAGQARPGQRQRKPLGRSPAKARKR